MTLWTPSPRTVRAVRQETADTVTFELDCAQEPMAFLPGQFNMLYLYGQGEVPISIAGDAADPHVLTHTVRGVGSVTKPMVQVQPGDVIGVRGPFGTPWPLDQLQGRDVIVVAGGIGLAPLRGAFLHLLRNRDQVGRVILLYGARSPSEMLYTDELHAWRGRFDTTVEVTVDRAEPGWQGPVGVVTRLFDHLRFDADDAAVLCCGPEIMMRFVLQEALRRGVSLDRQWLTMERNMKCAVGLCGHCQWGSAFLCKDGAVFRADQIADRLRVREL